MKKGLVFVFFLVFFVLAVSVPPYGSAEAQTITLKALTAWPKNASDNKSLDFFLESVEKQLAKKYPGERM